MTTQTSRQNFLQAFAAATQPGPKEGQRVLDGHVMLQLEEQPDTALKLGENEVYLSDIYASEPYKGHGTAALKFLCNLASEHSIDIVLHAAGNRDESPSDWELVQFYKKHGFIKCGGGYNAMFRPSNSPT